MTYVNYRRDVPEGPHWAIITFSTVHIPGDERSRTNPGHGYPARDEPVVTYQAFENKEVWEEVVRRIEERTGYGQGQYIAGYFTPATIEKVVRIKGMD